MAIGSLTAALGGIDGVVFTGGIGEHAVEVRARALRALSWLGVNFDDAANSAGGPRISAAKSEVSAWAIPTDEEATIARHVISLISPLAA
jgi:acetate kinase